MKTNKLLKSLFIIVLLIANVSCDQISKNIVRQKIEYNTQINVISNYLILTKVENTGAFLGLGDTIPRPLYKLLMIAFPLIVIGYALFYLIKKDTLSILFITGVSFMIGGGLGNIYDRILHGSVTDFLYFDFVLFHTGVVNMADISVTAGFCILLYDLYFNRKKPKTIE
ncbi:MAG: signal peptidase II [Tannerella sp.]|jgi:signal peptidase II|nr:signal peptidase II [Tannerella sp.]